MSENLMVGSHKHSTKKYRDNYDQIFRKKKQCDDKLKKLDKPNK